MMMKISPHQKQEQTQSCWNLVTGYHNLRILKNISEKDEGIFTYSVTESDAWETGSEDREDKQ
jgi:hypothetical protein